MTRFQLLRIRNSMFLANGFANLIGVIIVNLFTHRPSYLLSAEITALSHRIDMIFQPLAFLVPVALTLIYEWPIRKMLGFKYRNEPVPERIALKGPRRLLNEPYFLIILDFGTWLIAAVLYSSLFWAFNADKYLIRFSFFISLYTGLITTTVAFFILERVLQRWMVPHFFPEGRLSATPGTVRIRLSTRLTAFLFACNIVPFFSFISRMKGLYRTGGDPADMVEKLQSVILVNSFMFMAVGIWLTALLSRNLRRPIEEIIQVLHGIRKGNFDKKVRVISNDEIGYTGDVINEMTDGLKERDLIKETFGRYVTREIRDEILAGRIPLDGELKEVTVLFADLRNFTPMVESTPPKEVVKIINDYYKEMDEAIKEYHGLVLQYIGDEIEAVFGAPISMEDHPEMAVRGALEMRKRLRDVNRDLEREGYAPLSHGIGIHTGEVVAANIGSPDRLSYALVGDTVNLASRLQGLNKEFGTEIIISAATRERLSNGFPLKKLPAARVKGKSQLVDIFTLG